MIRAPRLAPGDPVRVIAPSGPVPREAFVAGLEVLRARYEVRYDDGVFARDGYLAGPDERRLAELTSALADPDARAIVMARGGYGLMRLLPFVDTAALVTARARSSASPMERRCWRWRRAPASLRSTAPS